MNCGDPTQNITSKLQIFLSGSPPNQTVYPTSVAIKCQNGYLYQDGSVVNTLSCQANAAWLIMPQCIGKLAVYK